MLEDVCNHIQSLNIGLQGVAVNCLLEASNVRVPTAFPMTEATVVKVYGCLSKVRQQMSNGAQHVEALELFGTLTTGSAS